MVRWLDSGDFMSDEFRVIYSGGKVRQRGVALLIYNFEWVTEPVIN